MEIATAPHRLTTRPSWLLGQASLAAQRLVADALAPLDAHRSHVAVLAALDEHGPLSQAELGRRCGIDRSDMVALVNRLEAADHVRRTTDPDDRRRNLVTITAAGRRRLTQLDRRVDQAQQQLLAGLDRRERAQLVELLTKVVEHQHP